MITTERRALVEIILIKRFIPTIFLMPKKRIAFLKILFDTSYDRSIEIGNIAPKYFLPHKGVFARGTKL
jgi:hypothetical protein